MADKPVCKIEGCSKPARGHGWCSAHYARWRNHGSPLGGGKFREWQSGTCTVDGCDKSARSLGYCNAHYLRNWQYGAPEGGERPMVGEARRWLADVALPYRGEDCLIWPYSTRPDGRGQVGRNSIASRVVCTEAHGEPPTSVHQAAHSCGNGHLGCVNPMHLRWATQVENCADMIDHGTAQRGSRHPQSKLTEDQVREIRKLSRVASLSAIAEKYGVAKSTIRGVTTSRNWAWLD